MKSAAGNPVQRIHPLTSMRFFASIMVVFYHTLPRAIPGFSLANFPGRLVSVGNAAVSFFFLLSGYILAVVYLRSGAPLERRRFWAARFARIYPLFFVTLVLDTPTLLLPRIAKYGLKMGVLKTTVTFFSNTVMLQAWIPRLQGINNPNWSLSTETFFYLAFPMLGVLLWKLRGARIWIAALLIYAGGQALVWAVAPHLDRDFVWKLPALHLSTFLLGILLARWQQEMRDRPEAAPVRQWQAYAVLLVAIVGSVCAINGSENLFGINLVIGLLAPVFVAIIWGLSSADTWISRLLSLPWLVILGEASYGLYLIHVPVWNLFTRFHLDETWGTYPACLPTYFAYLFSSIGLSVLSFYYLETPTRKWLLRKLASRPRETMELASDAQ